MGLFNNLFSNLSKLTQAYDDDEDTFEGAIQEEPEAASPAQQDNAASRAFERTFGSRTDSSASEPEVEDESGDDESATSGRRFGGFMSKIRKPAASSVSNTAPAQQAAYMPASSAAPARSSAPAGTAVIYTFDDITRAGELASIICSGQQVILSLDNVDDALGRRLLDVTIGICAAANANVIKVSGRTYYVTPRI